MSKPEQKKAAAEARWEAAQLQAANAQRELDYAVAVFEKESAGMPKEDIDVVNAKIWEQQETIKKFLLNSHSAFTSAMKEYEFKVSK